MPFSKEATKLDVSTSTIPSTPSTTTPSTTTPSTTTPL